MNTSTLRKVIAASVISGAVVLTSLAGGGASADGGQHEVGHLMDVAPPAAAPIHKATDVTMKRGIIGGFKSMTGAEGGSGAIVVQAPAESTNPGFIYIRRLDMDAIK
jgi:hypothetical protein